MAIKVSWEMPKTLSSALKINKIKLLKRIGLEYASFTKQRYLSGNPVRVRSGRLRASFGNKSSKADGIFVVGDESVVVGTSVKYAGIINDGGTILAKSGKYLAIPLTPVLTPAGVPRFTWKHKGDIKRQFPDLFVLKTRNKKLFLAKNVNGRPIPYFKLQKSVTIKGRKYLQKSLNGFTPLIEKIIYDEINRSE